MKQDEYPVKAAAENAVDERGEVLWVERYIFTRIHGPGETSHAGSSEGWDTRAVEGSARQT